MRTKTAKTSGDKRDGIEAPWQKVKYDRQIVAVAKTERAAVIYSTDKHIHEHAKLWGIRVMHLADLPFAGMPTLQSDIFGDPQ